MTCIPGGSNSQILSRLKISQQDTNICENNLTPSVNKWMRFLLTFDARLHKIASLFYETIQVAARVSLISGTLRQYYVIT